jgi:hypothetical protein
LIHGRKVGDALIDVGLIPKHCASVEILTPADGPLQIRYTVNVPDKDLSKLAKAFQALADQFEAPGDDPAEDR